MSEKTEEKNVNLNEDNKSHKHDEKEFERLQRNQDQHRKTVSQYSERSK